MYCRKCATPLPEDTIYCINCGTAVLQSPSSGETPDDARGQAVASATGNVRTLFPVLAGAVLVAAFAFGLYQVVLLTQLIGYLASLSGSFYFSGGFLNNLFVHLGNGTYLVRCSLGLAACLILVLTAVCALRARRAPRLALAGAILMGLFALWSLFSFTSTLFSLGFYLPSFFPSVFPVLLFSLFLVFLRFYQPRRTD